MSPDDGASHGASRTASSAAATQPTSPATSRTGGDPRSGGTWPRRLIVVLLVVSGLLTFVYSGASIYFATQLVTLNGRPTDARTPAELGLDFRDVTFPSREDHLELRGWLIPGVLPGGRLTTNRTIVVMHGHGGFRDDPTIKLLNLVGDLAHHGFAVLTFDGRNCGQSAKGFDGVGYFEYRDVLGAVDFLRTGALPYPALGRARIVGGWGISMGAVSMLYAAAREPTLAAVVSDSAFADVLPILERDFPKAGTKVLPALGPIFPAFLPGMLLAANALYGLNQYANRPVDVVAGIAPRPIFFIHADHDDSTPSSMMDDLAAAASAPANAHVQSWKVANVFQHAQSYSKYPVEYLTNVTTFYTAALGPDQGPAA
jgi:pimeloyl-ACP methyl ester carboxylesterase